MTVLLRAVAVLFVAIGGFLLFAVVHAMGTAGGAKPAVAIGYVLGALVLGFLAFRLWTVRKGPATI